MVKQTVALINMETFQMESCVRGYHVYKDLWEAVVGERLECQREHDNPSDTYAVECRKRRNSSWLKTFMSLCSLSEEGVHKL